MDVEKTAVEWLVEKLGINVEYDSVANITFGLAKEMEKEQIMNAYMDARDPYGATVGNTFAKQKAEKYYNEIYGR
jgi:hypothetical protein